MNMAPVLSPVAETSWDAPSWAAALAIGSRSAADCTTVLVLVRVLRSAAHDGLRLQAAYYWPAVWLEELSAAPSENFVLSALCDLTISKYSLASPMVRFVSQFGEHEYV